ncbi:hypothetical protein OG215_39950 (plasmid) [Streptomyces globisporus]|uniref:hypothetical protein n=1 Tax=Streptomyces globisporus TaxID=1908 RepID=UPI002F90F457|nr:hypothetical protein OG215_39950 [Streptomyces globisporus]
MRTASSSTKEMGLDGIAPAGFQMENIPARIYENGQIEALFSGQDDEDGESTAGMAYMFLDGRAKFMRTFFAEKVDGVYPDLIALYGEEPANGLTRGEAAAAQAKVGLYDLRHTNPYADCDSLAQAFSDAPGSTPAAAAPATGTDGEGGEAETPKLLLLLPRGAVRGHPVRPQRRPRRGARPPGPDPRTPHGGAQAAQGPARRAARLPALQRQQRLLPAQSEGSGHHM